MSSKVKSFYSINNFMIYNNFIFLILSITILGCMSPHKEQYSHNDSSYVNFDTIASVSDTLNVLPERMKMEEFVIVDKYETLAEYAPLYKYPYTFNIVDERAKSYTLNKLKLNEDYKGYYLEKLQGVLEKHYLHIKELRNIFKDTLEAKVVPLGQFKYPEEKLFNSQLVCISIGKNERDYDFVLLENIRTEDVRFLNFAILAMNYGGAIGEEGYMKLSSKFDVDSTVSYINIDQILEEADGDINNEGVPIRKKDIKIKIKIDSCPECEKIPEDFIKYVKE